jgi:hypothetical protein
LFCLAHPHHEALTSATAIADARHSWRAGADGQAFGLCIRPGVTLSALAWVSLRAGTPEQGRSAGDRAVDILDPAGQSPCATG